MFIFFLLAILSLGLYTNKFFVYADSECYARVEFNQTYLYREPILDNSTSNTLFELPKTYFVKLIDRAGDDFYLANYNGISGYVKKDSVRAISGTPSSPYLTNISFRVYAEPSRDMRTYPSNDSNLSNQVVYIPLYSKNIEYLGSIKGQELILNRTNVWYYCKYTADKDYYGYVYSDFCDEMTPLYDNTEQFSYTDNPTFLDVKESNEINHSKMLGLIIAIMSIPAVIFIVLILRGKHILDYKSKREVIDY